MTAQSATGPIVGYRCWVEHRGRLRCATSNEYWPAGVMEARCGDNEPHLAPEPTCRCGIHGVDSHATALRYRDRHHRRRPWRPRSDLVVGAVQLWGAPGRPVIVGEVRKDRHGLGGLQYRAPYARILALSRSPQAERVARTLGVPVVDPEYLEAFAREVGGVQLKPEDVANASAVTDAPGLRRQGHDRAAAMSEGLGPATWEVLKTIAEATGWLLWRAARVTWWLMWRTAWLIGLALVAVLGLLLEDTAPRRRR